MSIIGLQRRVSPFLIAAVLLLQLSPALAETNDSRRGPVEVTFTKWVTGNVSVPDNFGFMEGRGLMEGHTGGDIPGTFVGEVLQGQPSANPALQAGINKLEAIYEVHDLDGNHVFTALVRGGTNRATGAALLDGVILAGWRTGAQVHVEFQTYAPQPTGPGCPDTRAPADRNCLLGTIHIERAPKE